jgi:hypothetical protein
MYLNSGDWVENMTALEYKQNKWEIYTYNEMDYVMEPIDEIDIVEKTTKDIFNEMLSEFNNH